MQGRCDVGKKFRQKLLCCVAVDDVGAAAAEVDLVQKAWGEGFGGAVRERDDRHRLGEVVDDGECLAFARRRFCLDLGSPCSSESGVRWLGVLSAFRVRDGASPSRSRNARSRLAIGERPLP